MSFKRSLPDRFHHSPSVLKPISRNAIESIPLRPEADTNELLCVGFLDPLTGCSRPRQWMCRLPAWKNTVISFIPGEPSSKACGWFSFQW